MVPRSAEPDKYVVESQLRCRVSRLPRAPLHHYARVRLGLAYHSFTEQQKRLILVRVLFPCNDYVVYKCRAVVRRAECE